MNIKNVAITAVALTYVPTILEAAFIIIKLGFIQDYNSFLTDFSNWLAKAIIPWWLKPFELISRLPSIIVAIGLIGLAWIIKVSRE